MSCTVGLKLNMIKYTKEHGNRIPSRHFRPLPTVNMIHKLRGQDKNKSEKNKCSFCKHTVKWPFLKAEVRNWITNTETTEVLCLRNWLLFKQEDGWFYMASLILLWEILGVTDPWRGMDCETRDNCESLSRNMISVMAVTVLQMMMYLKKVKAWTRLRF